MQRHKLNVRVIIAKRSMERIAKNRNMAAEIVVIQLEWRLAAILGRVDAIYKNGNSFFNIAVLEREADVVAENLPDPKPSQLVD